MTFRSNFRTQFSHVNPFDTMKFQYFALISTGMRGTHVHLSIMTLIYGLNLIIGMGLWLYGVSSLLITFTQFTTFYLNVT